jgi:hypothetical protein
VLLHCYKAPQSTVAFKIPGKPNRGIQEGNNIALREMFPSSEADTKDNAINGLEDSSAFPYKARETTSLELPQWKSDTRCIQLGAPWLTVHGWQLLPIDLRGKLLCGRLAHLSSTSRRPPRGYY